MNVWLDDVRSPEKYGRVGWTWIKTFDAAIEVLATGEVTAISLDHDLGWASTLGFHDPAERNGYHVVCWMEECDVWPEEIFIHTANPVGRDNIIRVLQANNKRFLIAGVL